MPELVGAIDQGTTSTRFLVFDHSGREVARHQVEHRQILPRPGWVEHDPVEIWDRASEVVARGLEGAGLSGADLAAVGLASQRETTLVWDPRTGRPYGNAIVWQDTRSDAIVAALQASGGGEIVRRKAGLPPATYFSAGKLAWMLDNVEGLRQAAGRGEAVAGTVDTWLLWRLTGGPRGGAHLTDVTNASRTMLMDLETLRWDPELLGMFAIPPGMLAQIRPSAEPAAYGTTSPAGPFGAAVPIAAVLGDQQAALVGQLCLGPGEAKCTHGTGSFLLLNTGASPIHSAGRLLTTVAYRMGEAPPAYALEGSIAVTGSAVQWLRDQLGIIGSAAASEGLAAQVGDTGGVYLVPAFSGLFAPYWRPGARGLLTGLTRATTSAHLARAALEAIAYQTRDVVLAMEAEAGIRLEELRVDGGVTANDLCMQLQADILGIPLSRPAQAETTALGAAYAAGLAVGLWGSEAELRANRSEARRWEPRWGEGRREEAYAGWKRAVGLAAGTG